ncbi:hypothetical protein EV175_000507 [Coemansia sp. RSA 1933]|nr:hypothetical protein EV175_000507 [Coemansia sp. RSA 1933]
MAASEDQTVSSQPPFGGRYVALLRRTNAGMLFSDPVYVKDGQSLPELPEGLQFVMIHPSAAQAKARTMKDFVPTSSSRSTENRARPQTRTATVPLEEDYGMFSSFLPSRDSSLSSFMHTDYNTISSGSSNHCLLESGEPKAHVSSTDVESALELAERILGDSDSNVSAIDLQNGIPQDILTAIGLESPPSTQMHESQSHTSDSNTETAESILRENSALLVRLVELQDKRAHSNTFDEISNEEKSIAAKLQDSFVRVVAANEPSALRPSSIEIKRAANALLAKQQPVFSGVLLPQKRFAYVSNAASSTEIPQSATATPMQRQPPVSAKQQFHV